MIGTDVTDADQTARTPPPGPATPGGAQPETTTAPARRARLVPGQAGIGSIFVLAFIVILVPGIAVYLVAHAFGLGLGPAGLLGLLAVLVCLGFYPSVLLRLGWVRKRPRRR